LVHPSGKTRVAFDRGASVREFLGAAPGALKNHLNTVELTRITLTSLTAAAGTLGLLQAILASIGGIFPAPTDAALAALILTLILESLRRLGHGRELASDGAMKTRVPRGERGGRAGRPGDFGA
jgi:hypothetical protein